MILGMERGVLLWSVVSCCILLCILFRAGSTGTEVKRAFMSNDDMVFPCCIWMDLACSMKCRVFLIWWGSHLPGVRGCWPFP